MKTSVALLLGETLIVADLQEALAVSGTSPINSVRASSLRVHNFNSTSFPAPETLR